jgi:hypothetical protein
MSLGWPSDTHVQKAIEAFRSVKGRLDIAAESQDVAILKFNGRTCGGPVCR